MAFDPRFEIDVTWVAAAAAYTIMTDPNPVLPTNYELVGALVASSQHALSSFQRAVQVQPAQLRIPMAMLADSHIFGLVAWNPIDQTVLLAIRGTETIWEWIEDIDAVPVPFIAVPGIGFVHMGFQLVYELVRPNIHLLLTKYAGAKRILVTGHSLGAAVAVLASVDIAKSMKVAVAPELHSYAGPRVVAPDFESKFSAIVPTCFRVVNFMDVVPQVPLPPLYEHVGQEQLVHGGFKPLDVTFAHHLTTYLTGLNKLVP